MYNHTQAASSPASNYHPRGWRTIQQRKMIVYKYADLKVKVRIGDNYEDAISLAHSRFPRLNDAPITFTLNTFDVPQSLLYLRGRLQADAIVELNGILDWKTLADHMERQPTATVEVSIQVLSKTPSIIPRQDKLMLQLQHGSDRKVAVISAHIFKNAIILIQQIFCRELENIDVSEISLQVECPIDVARMLDPSLDVYPQHQLRYEPGETVMVSLFEEKWGSAIPLLLGLGPPIPTIHVS